MGGDTRSTCACCGYKSLKRRPGDCDICPICFWEDDPVQNFDPWCVGGANKVSLAEAQRSFVASGVSEARFKDDVRAPSRKDVRDPAWRPVTEADRRHATSPAKLQRSRKPWRYYWQLDANVVTGRRYPRVADPKRVGKYPAVTHAGGGYTWDEVLEYRVWCHPEAGAPDLADGSDYYYAFASYAKALAFSAGAPGAEEPLALIRQRQHINEPAPGQYVHVKTVRLTEWPVEFLARPRRGPRTIPDFLSPDAPANRLDILRGLAKPPRRRKKP